MSFPNHTPAGKEHCVHLVSRIKRWGIRANAVIVQANANYELLYGMYAKGDYMPCEEELHYSIEVPKSQAERTLKAFPKLRTKPST